MAERLVVIGGGAAGMSAASRARRCNPDLAITVLEAGSDVAYGACGLPYLVSGVIKDPQELMAYGPETFRGERRIGLRLNHAVEEIDVTMQVVLARDQESGQPRHVPFDRLVIAAGARASRIPLPGAHRRGIFTLRTLADAQSLMTYMAAEKPMRAVVLGGGYIGLEAAEALRHRGLAVTVVEMLPQILNTVDPEMAALVMAEMVRNGVEVRTGTRVEGLPGDDRVRAVATSTGDLPADLVLMALGARPNVESFAAAGIAVGSSGAIRVDRRQATNVPGIWAAGDVAEAVQLVTGAPAWVPLGTNANKMGRVAGENAAGGQAEFPGVVGTAGLRLFDLEIARTGLTLVQAAAAGFDAVAATVKHRTRAHYYPGGGAIHGRVILDRQSRRLLGAQMAGPEGAAKRIDVCAAALQGHWTVDMLEALDATYSPPFAPVWDPVIMAAREGVRILAGT